MKTTESKNSKPQKEWSEDTLDIDEQSLEIVQ